MLDAVIVGRVIQQFREERGVSQEWTCRYRTDAFECDRTRRTKTDNGHVFQDM